MRTRVCVDFDGVMTDYDGHWEKEQPPLEGSLDFVRRLIAEGYQVDILSARPAHEIFGWFKQYAPDLQEGYEWVDPPEGYTSPRLEWNLHITNTKRPAVVYIDDRGFRFEGDFGAAYDAIHQACWWMSKEGAFEGWTPDGLTDEAKEKLTNVS